MAGAALAAAAALVAATLALGAAAAGGASALSQRLAGAADSAALAAADAASGAVPVDGDPCDAADRIARAFGAALDSCALNGPVAIVHVSAAYAGFTAVAGSRAGPPEAAASDG